MKKLSFLGLVIMCLSFASCDLGEIESKDERIARIKEVWIWDRVELNAEGAPPLVLTTKEEWRKTFFSQGIGYFVIPYAFVFFDNGYYYSFCDPDAWNLFLKENEDEICSYLSAELWKIEDSFFYTTYTTGTAPRDAELGKEFTVVSNNSNTIVLRPIEFGMTYDGRASLAWTITLKKKKYGDFHYEGPIWWEY